MKNNFKLSIVFFLILSALFLDHQSVMAKGLIQELATDQNTDSTPGWDALSINARQTAIENLINEKNQIFDASTFVPNPNSTLSKSFDYLATYPFDPYADGVITVTYDGWDTVYLSDTIPAYSTFYYVDVVDLKTGAITVVSIGGDYTVQPGDVDYDNFLLQDIRIVEKAIELSTDKTQTNDLNKILNKLEHFALKNFS